jgi:hypothetical protein
LDQCGLAGFLKRQGSDDAVEGVELGCDQAAIDRSGRRQKERGIAADVALYLILQQRYEPNQ